MGHGKCFPSHHGKRDMYDSYYAGPAYGGPAYAAYDDALPQELLDNISNLGVDAVHFDGRSRAPSINRAGRMASSDGAAGGWAPNGRQPMMDVHRAMSVKAVPGTQLQWTASRTRLEDELQQANAHPGPANDTDVHRLAMRLQHLKLDMWEMVGDGNCQFRSISNALYGSEQHHGLVRDTVVRYMAANKAEFEPYLGEDWRRYINDMAADGTWGDELTLRACCDAYGIMFSVITSDEAHWFVRYKPSKLQVYKGSPREVFLTYISPVHYNAIRRRTSQPQQGSGQQGSFQQGSRTRLEALQEVSGHSAQSGNSDAASPFAAVQQTGQPVAPFV